MTYSVNQMENMRVYALSALILVQEVSRNLNFSPQCTIVFLSQFQRCITWLSLITSKDIPPFILESVGGKWRLEKKSHPHCNYSSVRGNHSLMTEDVTLRHTRFIEKRMCKKFLPLDERRVQNKTLKREWLEDMSHFSSRHQ